MKKAFSILTLILISTFSSAQMNDIESKKIANFCKVWGFLKYYHPKVATGSINWDKEFTSKLKLLESLNSKEEISSYYLNWIQSLGNIKDCKNCSNEVPDSLKFNLDLNWISDSSLFTNDLIELFQTVLKNRNQKKNYYVHSFPFVGNTNYKNEELYKDSVFPSVELRLLGLSRYWNIINYFYPYKYRIDQNWNDVLIEMIPMFKDSKDTINYHLAMLELVVKLNDSHANFISKYTNRYFGNKSIPFKYKLIDEKAIVIGFINDSLCLRNDIQYGDVFIKIADTPVYEKIKNELKYIGASNYPTKLRNYIYLFNGRTDSIPVTFERNGNITQKYLYRYSIRDFNYKIEENGRDTSKIINGNIGYVNLGVLQKSEIKKILDELINTKAIIFDVRNYPKGTMYEIADFLNNESRPFAKFTYPDLNFPGVFRFTEPYTCGRKNKNSYKGKVILLFNESSQSHAEFTLMALQTAPNVISIGSQTAGADGNVSSITFPGGYNTWMTGIGVYYPDGRETQRVGIVPDIEVLPTIEGIRLKKDEVLEKAIQVINENGK